MRYNRVIGIAVAVVACLVMGLTVSAQNAYYSQAQIEQFVAPVALYPDALLAQVFMAATYPGEVVDANGWAQRNSRLRGDSLAQALDDRDWDVSVKSLVPFPDVLSRMAENEAWMQDLGDAFLAQPNDVTDAVQRLRHRSYEAGYLRTSPQQRVVYEGQYIQIVPTSVDIIYVPAYNSMTVYGPGWGYPTYYYPSMMMAPSYYRAGSPISFGIGFSVGFSLFGMFDWGQHSIYYGPNFYQYRGYHRYAQDWRQHHSGGRPGDRDQWAHQPSHRGPGGYRNPQLNERYGRGSYPTQGGHDQNRPDPRAHAESPRNPGNGGMDHPKPTPAGGHPDRHPNPFQPAPTAKPDVAPRHEAGPSPASHPVDPALRGKPQAAPRHETGPSHPARPTERAPQTKPREAPQEQARPRHDSRQPSPAKPTQPNTPTKDEKKDRDRK